MDYEQQALDFLERVGAVMEILFVGIEKPDWDNQGHTKYKVTIIRGEKRMYTEYYDSLNNTHIYTNTGNFNHPSFYDVLSHLVKSDPGTLGDFVSEYGYEMKDHRTVTSTTKTWMACVDQWRDVKRLFGDVLDEISEVE